MKQKRHDDKRQNALNTRNKRTAPSSAYKRIKRATKDSQKRNLDNQTDNKDDNRKMSIGLGKERKTMDQKAEKPISLKEAVTTTSSSLTASSKSPPSPQSEVFDSSNDNAMLEMKVADMRPDKTAKVFLHIEEKQLDPISTSINNSIKKTDSENILNTNLNPTSLHAKIDLTLEKSDSSSAVESIKEDVVTKDDIEQNNPQIYNELEEHNNLDESARFYGNENKESYSDLSNNGNINPFIVGIKLWQDHNIAWINAYNEFIKEWIGNIKIGPNNI